MKYQQLFYFLLLVLFFSCSTANNDESATAMSAETPTKATIAPTNFGCKINGEQWYGKITRNYLTQNGERTTLDILGSSIKPNTTEFIRIKLPKFKGIASYVNKKEIQYSIKAILPNEKGKYFTYNTNYEAGGSVDLNTYDEATKTISGIFSFILISSDGGQDLQITEGKFEDVVLED